MFKKLLAVLTVCFAVSGCSDTVQMITREDAELDQIQMEELKEKIDKQIVVTKEKTGGSRVEIVV